MHIVLLILKILGIAVLAILGLLLFLLLLVLFVPVRYSAEGKIEKDFTIQIRGKAHWLLHVISAVFSGSAGGFSYTVRIFGIRILPGKEKKKRRKEKAVLEPEEASGEMTEPPDEPLREAEVPEKNGAVPIQKDARFPENKETAPHLPEKKREPEKEADIDGRMGQNKDSRTFFERLTEKGRALLRRITGVFQRIRERLRKLPEALKSIRTRLQEIRSLITDEANRSVVKKVLHELKYLLRHFKFRRITTDLSFSLDDPAATGQALGVICLIPALYRYDFQLSPDFEANQAYLEGTFRISGRIRLIHVLVTAIRLISDQEVRGLIKKVMEHS